MLTCELAPAGRAEKELVENEVSEGGMAWGLVCRTTPFLFFFFPSFSSILLIPALFSLHPRLEGLSTG